MSNFFHELAVHLPLGLAVVTVLLAIGSLALAIAPWPVVRQRIAELTLCATLGWLVLALAPLPRLFSWNVHPQPQRSSVLELAIETEPNAVGGAAAPGGKMATESSATAAPHSASALPSDGNQLIAAPDADLLRRIELLAKSSDDATHRADIGPSPVSQIELILERCATGYLITVSAGALWLLIGHALLLLERRRAMAAPAWLARLLDRACRECGASRPCLLVSKRCSRPISWGLFRPVILLPEKICQPDNEPQLRAILLHELGHVCRRDAWGNVPVELAFPLLLVHPLYWWLRGQARLAAELLADDWAAERTGKEAYVTELVALARSAVARPVSVLPATSIFSSSSQFYRRMHMLLAREKPLTKRMSPLGRYGMWGLLLTAVAGAAALVGSGPAIGQQATPSALPAATPNIDASAAETARLLDEIQAMQRRLKELQSSEQQRAEVDRDRLVAEVMKLRKQVEQLQAQTQAERANGLYKANVFPTPAGPETRYRVVEAKDGDKWISTYVLVPGQGEPKLVERRALTDTAKPNAPTATEARPDPAPGQVPRAIAEWKIDANTLEPPQAVGNVVIARATRPGDFVYRATPPGAEASAEAWTSSRIDLLALANSYADAQTAVELATAKIADELTAAKIAETSQQHYDAHERQALRVELDMAKRKEQMIRRIVELAANHAKQEYEQLAKLHGAGAVSGEALEEARLRMEILQQILGPSANQPQSKSETPDPRKGENVRLNEAVLELTNVLDGKRVEVQLDKGKQPPGGSSGEVSAVEVAPQPNLPGSQAPNPGSIGPQTPNLPLQPVTKPTETPRQ